jgi:hypothetical protein
MLGLLSDFQRRLSKAVSHRHRDVTQEILSIQSKIGKSQCRNPKSESNPNDECPNGEKVHGISFGIRHSGFGFDSGFGLRHSSGLGIDRLKYHDRIPVSIPRPL